MQKSEMMNVDSYQEWYMKNNNTNTQYPNNKTLQELFEEQVEKTPDSVAVNYEGQVLTYAQLNTKANQVARLLLDKGVKLNDIVAIMVEQSFEMMIGILGILKSGAAYMPIDSNYPKDRINYMVTDSNVRILLVNKEIAFNETIQCEIVNLKDKKIYHSNGENVKGVGSPDNYMYVIYTSGSTGKPKGVMIYHYAFANLITWFINEFDITCEDKNLLIASISFDLAQKNLYATLLTGGQLFLSDASPYNYSNMSDIIDKYGITLINCTPSAFYPFIDYNINSDYHRLRSLRYAFLGGEHINAKRIGNMLQFIKCELVNTYGPTECTDIVSSYRIKKEDLDSGISIPIGKPIYNTELYILDEDYNLLPPEGVGDLYVGGVGVSPGYFNNELLTQERFITLDKYPNMRIYKTGDRAKWLSNGYIELVGRSDFQIKIRGYRIELEEIEAVLANYSGVKGTIVGVRERPDGSKYLCAYLMMDGELSILDIKQFLSNKLPDYMVPTTYLKVNDFPLSSNGKIDRKALDEMKLESDELPNDNVNKINIDLNEDSTEYKVRAIFKECLMNNIMDNLQINDDLSVLNLDSLIFIRLVVCIEDEFDIEFDDENLDMDKFDTLQSLILYIESKI